MPEPTATPATDTAATATPILTPVPTATLIPTVAPSPTPNTIVAAFAKFESGVTVKFEGEFAVISSNAVPNHSSPYFFKTDARYQQYNGTNPSYAQNPNVIYAQTLVFRIPLKPEKATASQPTPLGPIGISINGVPFFNEYAGTNRPLAFEINSFDQYNGHPQMFGMYHYHVEPLYLTAICGRDALLGYLLDGFPVYGPMEGGKLVTNADLDANHGHTHATAEYPGGIYHYHVTSEAPYINGVGFYGKTGSVGAR
ncbi:MAG: YHYH protein [Dehalococcoidia bacterium]|nr:YHYH protein [Dehalococcoidia bacterium]